MRASLSSVRENKKKLANAALYVVFLAVMILLVMSKANYHIDELFSYGGANQVYGHALKFVDGKTYKPASLLYDECLTVDGGERFAYGEVWNNQGKSSVHPPLYHAILHTICSFFPNTFSKWYAASINVVFALLALAAVRRLAFLLTDDDRLVFAVSLMFVFSTGVLAAVSFLRMYVMAMLWVTLLEVLLVGEAGSGKLGGAFFIKLYLIAVAGALTHYYCILFTVLICAVYCVCLMLKRRWKAVAAFCVTGALSGATAFAIFPAMIAHVLFSPNGVDAVENLALSAQETWERFQFFGLCVNRELFGDLSGYLATGTAMALAFTGIRAWLNRPSRKKARMTIADFGLLGVYAQKMLLIAVPCTAYFLFVAKTASYMADRYMFPIYGVAICGAFSVVFAVLKKALPAKPLYIVIALVAAATLSSEWRITQWDYLCRSSTALIEESKRHSDTDCLIIYDESWQPLAAYLEVINYNSVTFLQKDNLDMLTATEIAQNDELMVLLANVPDSEAYPERIMELCPQFAGYDEIGSYKLTDIYRWSDTYRFHL